MDRLEQQQQLAAEAASDSLDGDKVNGPVVTCGCSEVLEGCNMPQFQLCVTICNATSIFSLQLAAAGVWWQAVLLAQRCKCSLKGEREERWEGCVYR